MGSTPTASDGTVKPFFQTSARHQLRLLNPAVIGHHPAFICSESIRAMKVAGHFVGRHVSRHHGELTGSGQQVSKRGSILKNLLI